MRCPVCHSDMIVVEHNRIELDYCRQCHGVWFDAGELELLLESLDLESLQVILDDVLELPEAQSGEKKRRCPICGRKMKKANIGQEPLILIDVCSRGDGLWLDGGELHQLITQAAGISRDKPAAQKRVIDFLGEAFQAEK